MNKLSCRYHSSTQCSYPSSTQVRRPCRRWVTNTAQNFVHPNSTLSRLPSRRWVANNERTFVQPNQYCQLSCTPALCQSCAVQPTIITIHYIQYRRVAQGIPQPITLLSHFTTYMSGPNTEAALAPLPSPSRQQPATTCLLLLATLPHPWPRSRIIKTPRVRTSNYEATIQTPHNPEETI